MLKKIMDYDFLKPVLDSILNYEQFDYMQVVTPYMDKLKDTEGSVDKVITRGKPVKIENRTIYPVIMFSTIEFKDKFTYESITPFALAVIEADRKYFIPLDEENEKIKELLSEDGLWKELGLE
jgi:hypothetical protein